MLDKRHEEIAEQRAGILRDAALPADHPRHIPPAAARVLLAWCADGCPADEPTDVGHEDGDFC